MTRAGNYLDATFVIQGFCFSAFLGCQNGEFNAFFGFF